MKNKKILNINMTQQPTNPIESVMIPGSPVSVSLKSGNKITGSFYGFIPTKDGTFIVVLCSDLIQTNHYMIPIENVDSINFTQKLSSLINS
jgi:hypothetical protein